MFKFNLFISLLMTLFIVPSVQANVSWSFNSGNCLDCITHINNESYGNSHGYGASSNSNNVTVSAFSTTNDIKGPDAFETAHLTQWGGGFGVRSQEDGSINEVPDHAMDNDGNPDNYARGEADKGDVDAIQFSFDENTSLSGVNIGWRSGDSDITVMAHDGTGDKSLVGKTFAELLSNGWSLIGHYSNLQVGATEAINSANFFSSDWLITAYTPEAGNSPGWSFGNDFFKLSGLSGDVTSQENETPVPEPSIIALILMGLIGWKMSNNGSRRTISNVERILAA
jgi:hypothetical protein